MKREEAIMDQPFAGMVKELFEPQQATRPLAKTAQLKAVSTPPNVLQRSGMR